MITSSSHRNSEEKSALEYLGSNLNSSFTISFQIGGKWALTAAHCVIDEVTYQPYNAALLSIVLGLIDKGNLWRSRRAK